MSTLIVERVTRRLTPRHGRAFVHIVAHHFFAGNRRRLEFYEPLNLKEPTPITSIDMFRKDPTCRVLWKSRRTRQYDFYPDKDLFVPFIKHRGMREMKPLVCRIKGVRIPRPGPPFVINAHIPPPLEAPQETVQPPTPPRRSNRLRRAPTCEFCPDCQA